MGWSCGVIGLPHIEKTAVYNGLVGAGGVVANHSFFTVGAPNGCFQIVPDAQLSTLAEVFYSKKVPPNTLEVRESHLMRMNYFLLMYPPWSNDGCKL